MFRVRKKCICGQGFFHNHVEECNLLVGIEFSLKAELAVFKEDKITYQQVAGVRYMLLDSLLNHQCYDYFLKVIQYINSLLS